MKTRNGDEGFSLLETMIAATIASIAIVGAMGAVEVASRFVKSASLVDHALEKAQSRLESKRSVHWRMILLDDLDHDGVLETVMKDDGEGHDAVVGDGVYTAATEEDGITEVWTVEVDRPGPIPSVSTVTIRSNVTYHGPNGIREVRVETIRANPAYLGRAQS